MLRVETMSPHRLVQESRQQQTSDNNDAANSDNSGRPATTATIQQSATTPISDNYKTTIHRAAARTTIQQYNYETTI